MGFPYNPTPNSCWSLFGLVKSTSRYACDCPGCRPHRQPSLLATSQSPPRTHPLALTPSHSPPRTRPLTLAPSTTFLWNLHLSFRQSPSRRSVGIAQSYSADSVAETTKRTKQSNPSACCRASSVDEAVAFRRHVRLICC